VGNIAARRSLVAAAYDGKRRLFAYPPHRFNSVEIPAMARNNAIEFGQRSTASTQLDHVSAPAQQAEMAFVQRLYHIAEAERFSDSPFFEAGTGNTPPILSFEEQGASVQGPRGLMTQRTAKVGAPLALTVWVSDDAKYTSSTGLKPKATTPPVTIRWIRYRGPAGVTFAKDRPEVEKIDRKDTKAAFSGKATTTATFSEPGEYTLHVTANDYSGEGGGGFQCCWTGGDVKVTVQP
jgi:hypothetical protein